EFLDAIEPGDTEQVEQVELRSDELVLDEQSLAGVVDGNKQIRRRADTRERHVGGEDVAVKPDDVVRAPAVADQSGDEGFRIALLVVDRVMARPAPKMIDIAIIESDQQVVASAGVEFIR